MFCPQCGAQAEASVKFCRACGLNISELARSFTNPTPEPELQTREQAEQEITQVRGIRGLAVAYLSCLLSVLLLILILLIALGIDALGGHVNGQVMDTILVGFLTVYFTLSMAVGGWGMYNLWRGKFFKTRKERLINAYTLLLEQTKKPGKLASKPMTPVEVAETSSFHSSTPQISIAEPTTRELQPVTSNSGKSA